MIGAGQVLYGAAVLLSLPTLIAAAQEPSLGTWRWYAPVSAALYLACAATSAVMARAVPG